MNLPAAQGSEESTPGLVAAAKRHLKDSFQILFEHSGEPMVITDGVTGRILGANAGACALVGWSRESILERRVADFLPGGEEQNRAGREARRATGSSSGVSSLLDADGEEIPISFWEVECLADDGSLRVFIGFKDLRPTHRLQHAEATLDALFETNPDGKMVSGFDGRTQYANQAHLEVWGYSARDMKAPFAERWATTRKRMRDPSVLAEMTRRARNPACGPLVQLVEFIDGRFIEVRSNPILDSAGVPLAVSFTSRDVTERHLAAQRLAETAGILDLLSRNSPQGIVVADKSGKVLLVNERFMALWDLPATWKSLSTQDRLHSLADRAADPGAFMDAAVRLYDYDGEEFAFEVALQTGAIVRFETVPLRDADGQVIGRAGFHTDVTTERIAEATLRASEDRYRTLVTTLQVGVVMHNAEGQIIEANAAAERILGLTREQMFGLTAFDPRWRCIREDGTPCPGEEHPAVITRLTGEPCYDVLIGVEHASGELRWVIVNSQPLRDAAGALAGVVISFDDVTELRKAGELRGRARTADALQSLASTVAHKINNSLTSITGNAYLAALPGETVEALKEIDRASKDAAELVRDLMALSGAAEHSTEEVDVHAEISKIGAEVSPGSRLFRLRVPDPLPPVRMDREGFRLALRNLVENALQAGSQVHISARIEDSFAVSRRAEYAPTEPAPGRYLAVSVADNGPGLPVEIQGKLFEPFTTFRFTGRGLGLAATAGAMARQGGFVELVSSDSGCTATLLIPLS